MYSCAKFCDDWSLSACVKYALPNVAYVPCLVAFTGTLNLLTHFSYYFLSHLFICTYFYVYERHLATTDHAICVVLSLIHTVLVCAKYIINCDIHN